MVGAKEPEPTGVSALTDLTSLAKNKQLFFNP